jgi:hypothetical protein
MRSEPGPKKGPSYGPIICRDTPAETQVRRAHRGSKGLRDMATWQTWTDMEVLREGRGNYIWAQRRILG